MDVPRRTRFATSNRRGKLDRVGHACTVFQRYVLGPRHVVAIEHTCTIDLATFIIYKFISIIVYQTRVNNKKK